MKRAHALLLLSLAACTGSDPAEIQTTTSLATSEVDLSCEVQGSGEAVLVTVILGSIHEAGCVLGEGDRLLASAEDAPEQPLFSYDAQARARYAVLLPTSQPRFTLTFERPSERVSAEVELPAPFALTVPSMPVPALEPIPLTWELADGGDVMSVDVSGPCVAPLSRALVSDTGSYALQPGDLAFDQTGGPCALAIALERKRATVDLAIGAGTSSVSTSQVRTAALEVVR